MCCVCRVLEDTGAQFALSGHSVVVVVEKGGPHLDLDPVLVPNWFLFGDVPLDRLETLRKLAKRNKVVLLCVVTGVFFGFVRRCLFFCLKYFVAHASSERM